MEEQRGFPRTNKEGTTINALKVGRPFSAQHEEKSADTEEVSPSLGEKKRGYMIKGSKAKYIPH